ncbi:MAG: ABC transporter ATP-binding protein/permease [Clostridia bacterium]|nr:ABC transporter ATP-binding protein/permease [Clostridia bacterium]
MLELHDIKKEYAVAGETVHALKGISLKFRRSEFVSILGPSGCGKTTLLNIIGGLDKYTSGDLIIEGTSTKQYGDRDWDTYRNHSIGFIFQSYHLIPHQTILQNVELALMISGVSKQERRQRAIDALEKVGLKGKLNNRPNQLSGGQAQRVAIARALINDPEIVLADEPTGALDSVTSVQIMELLKEISKDRLVIMVTHNPELAEQYSTRIVKLLDGEVMDDSMPFDGVEEAEENDAQTPSSEDITAPIEENSAVEGGTELNESTQNAEGTEAVESAASGGKTNKGKKKKTSMSIGMAMSLSLKNLLSKSKRTAMVSVAGSIGIIGVSLVLAISAGVRGYISSMENDMLSGFPVSVTQSAYDFSSLMELSGGGNTKVNLEELRKGNKVYVNSLLDTLGTFSQGFEKTNNISDAYVSYVSDIPEQYVNLIQYGYDFNIANSIYTDFMVSDNLADHLPEGASTDFNGGTMSVAAIRAMYAAVLTHVEEYKKWGSMISSVETFSEIPANFDYVMSQYDVVAIDKNGEAVTTGYSQEELKNLFEAKDSLIMVLNDYKIDDLTLAQYGYFTEDEFLRYAYEGVGKTEEGDKTLVGAEGFPYSKFVGSTAKKFTYYPNDCIYTLVATPTLSEAEIAAKLTENGFPAPQAQYFANLMIEKRSESNDALKAYLDNDFKNTLLVMLKNMISDEDMANGVADMMVKGYYDDFRVHGDDEQSFIANAYTTEYTVKSESNDITLQAFADKDGYSKRVELGVSIILQKKESVSYGCLESGFYYTNALTKYILETEAESQIVEFIGEKGNLESLPMYVDYYYVAEDEAGKEYYVPDTVASTIETGGDMMSQMMGSITGTASSEITAGMLGGNDTPTAIFIYPVDFDIKNKITAYLDKWNGWCESGKSVIMLKDGKYTFLEKFDPETQITNFESVKEQYEKSEWITLEDGSQIKLFEESMKITYADTVGMIINMVNTMIQMITIALVAFTALSLVVSTVMIGIITYVSVVERVKEIGILRAVGARKKDIKRLFNSETFIIGSVAGVFGILVTYLLSLIINVIVLSLAGIWGIAALPWWQAIIMIAISVGLTLISGLIPAAAAAKKDPVVALRTE